MLGTKARTFKVRKTELFLTMPHPWADDLRQMPHREVKKCPTNARGDERAWNCSNHNVTSVKGLYTVISDELY